MPDDAPPPSAMTATSWDEPLLSMASTFGRSAMGSWAKRGTDFAVLLHATTSLEQLAKAYLARIHPALISTLDLDSLLHSLGLPHASKTPERSMKTIGAGAAVERACRLLVPLRPMESKLLSLLNERNDLVHMGTSSVGSARRSMEVYLRACRTLLEALEVSESEFFGDQAVFVATLLDQSLEEEHRSVLLKLERRRQRYSEVMSRLEPEAQRAVIALRQAEVDWELVEATECYVCGNQAALYGDFEFDDEQILLRGEAKWFRQLWLEVRSFLCPSCGLNLNVGELVSLGKDSVVFLEPIEVSYEETLPLSVTDF